jgi:hypothetical protein
MTVKTFASLALRYLDPRHLRNAILPFLEHRMFQETSAEPSCEELHDEGSPC